jgi:ABC-type sulfate/molybdate transport systems ATPase subunit
MFELLPRVKVRWASGPEQADEWVASTPGLVVSRASVLRANLSAAENIAWVPMYLQNLDRTQALSRAHGLLHLLGLQGAAGMRDAQLSSTQRAGVLLLQSLAQGLVEDWWIDRPAILLPDANHPKILATWLQALAPHYGRCTVVDYDWNMPLYGPADSDAR